MKSGSPSINPYPAQPQVETPRPSPQKDVYTAITVLALAAILASLARFHIVGAEGSLPYNISVGVASVLAMLSTPYVLAQGLLHLCKSREIEEEKILDPLITALPLKNNKLQERIDSHMEQGQFDQDAVLAVIKEATQEQRNELLETYLKRAQESQDRFDKRVWFLEVALFCYKEAQAGKAEELARVTNTLCGSSLQTSEYTLAVLVEDAINQNLTDALKLLLDTNVERLANKWLLADPFALAIEAYITRPEIGDLTAIDLTWAKIDETKADTAKIREYLATWVEQQNRSEVHNETIERNKMVGKFCIEHGIELPFSEELSYFRQFYQK